MGIGWGLSLSGGGVKGAAHVGALMALDEADLKPSLISGASAGAIVAGLYASGMDTKALADTLRYMKRVGSKWLDYNWPGILKAGLQLALHKPVTLGGLIKGDKLERYFERVTSGITLAQTRLPTCLTSVDINNVRLVLFASQSIPGAPAYTRIMTDAPLYQGMRASMSIPTVFSPMTELGVRLVDGGVWENIPVYPLYAMGASHVVAINVGYYGQPEPQVDNLFEIGAQAMAVTGYELARLRSRAADVIVNVPMGDIGVFSFKKIDEAIERGYVATSAAMQDIKRALSNTTKIHRPYRKG